VLRAHLREEPPPPHLFNGEVPASLSLVVLKALARAPEDRFPSVKAFVEALRLAAPLTDTGLATPTPVASPLRPPPAPRAARLELELGPLEVSCHSLSRSGCFVGTRAELALFSAGKLELPGVGALAVQVVRRVSAADAHRWHRLEGYFLEFVAPDARQRVLLDGLGGEAADLDAELALEHLRGWLWGDAYAVLGLAPDASVGEVQVALSGRFEHLDGLARRALSPRQARELAAARARVKNAGSVLSVLPRRLDFDATHGNWRGVAACLRAGLSLETLEGQHVEFVRKNPLAVERARALLARSRQAVVDGEEGARGLPEQALAAAPLWGVLHQLHDELGA
jgi:serine/threonine-protein kinase